MMHAHQMVARLGCDTLTEIPGSSPDQTTAAPELDASIGCSILRAWACARIERYVYASRAAAQWVKQLLLVISPPEAEEFFFANVALPAVRKLLFDGKHKEARRLTDYVEGLCLTGDWKRLNQTPSGQAHLAELRAAVTSHANPPANTQSPDAASNPNALQNIHHVTHSN